MFIKTLPAGRYFIGNPSTVLDDQDWLKFANYIDDTDPDEQEWNGVVYFFINQPSATIVTMKLNDLYGDTINNIQTEDGLIAVIEESYWNQPVSSLNVLYFQSAIEASISENNLKLQSDGISVFIR